MTNESLPAEEMVTEPDPSEYGVTKYGEAQWKWDHADQSRALEFFIAQHYYERVTAARRIAELEQQLADAARNYFALNTTPEPEGVVKAARRLVERIDGCAVSNPLTNTDVLWYTRLLREELANCSAPTKGEGL